MAAIMPTDHDRLRRYTFTVTWSEEDGEFVGGCLEFPSLSALAGTRAAALSMIWELVCNVVIDMRERGERIPDPVTK